MTIAIWNPTAFYLTNDTVIEGSTEYVASANNYNKLPSANPSLWNVATPPPSTAPSEQTLQFQQPAGVAGGAALTAGWDARPLNIGIPTLSPSGQSTTIPNLTLDIGGPSVYGGAQQFTLNAGTYGFWASVGNLQITSQCRLFDTTNNVVVALGTSVANDTRTTYSTLSGLITLTAPATFELQSIGFLISGGNQDWGQPTGFGTEVYATITFYQY